MLKKFFAALMMLCAFAAMAAVDVNKANDAQLDGIKGIGPTTSKAILDERKKGDFKNWGDLVIRVKGMGEKRAAQLSEAGLTVNGEAYKGAPAKADGKKDAKSVAAREEKKEAKTSESSKPAETAKK